MTWMLIRLVLSLAFVGLVLWFAARVAKKRGLGGGGAQGLIEVVARQRMGRSSSVNVVRIGDVVLVVGATEEQITLLAEVDNETIGATLREPEAPAAVRRPARPLAQAPAGQGGGHYAAQRHENPGPAYDGEAHAPAGYADERFGQGYARETHAPETYAHETYADDEYAGDGYAEPGYADHGYADQGYAEPEGRRAGAHHSDHRPVGGVHRPAAARTADGPLAGSVFDKNGWGTFVNELRERTVRRP